MTKRQNRFAEEYLVDLNATQAAARAGYSEKTAYSTGQRLLKQDEVRKQIEDAIKERTLRTEITQDRVLQEYARLGFFDVRKLFHSDGRPREIGELDDDTAACIAGVEVKEVYEGYGKNRELVGYVKKYKLADKKGALDSIGKHLGMFVDRTEQTTIHEIEADTMEAMLKAAGYERKE